MRVRFTMLVLILLVATLFPAAAQAQCAPGKDYASQGDSLLQSGNYEQAVDAYTCAIEANDQDANLYYQRSEAYYSLLDYDNTLADLKRADKLAPNVALIQFGLGKVYYAMNQEQIALPYFDTAASVATGSSDSSFVLENTFTFRGLTEIQLQQYDKAIKDFNRAIELDPKWILPLYYRAVSHANLRHYEAAVSDFNRVVELSPNIADISFLLGDVGVIVSDYDGLVADVNTLTVSLQLSPRDAELFLKRGTTHLKLGEIDEAISDLDQVIELDNKNAEAYYQRAQAREIQQSSEAAVADYNRAIEIDATNADYYLNRSVAYQALNDYEHAIADSSQYIKMKPDDENGYLNRGIQYALNSQSDKAAVDFLAWADRIQTDEEDAGPLTGGEPVVVPMAQGSVFRFTFEGKAGEHLSLSAVPTQRYADIDTLIIILGPDGTPLTGKDDNVPQLDIHNRDYDFSATIDNFEVPEDGTYTLIVTHAGGNNEGLVSVEAGPAIEITGTT
jgi:tetratricopeptide (TPR) repeat protein